MEITVILLIVLLYLIIRLQHMNSKVQRLHDELEQYRLKERLKERLNRVHKFAR